MAAKIVPMIHVPDVKATVDWYVSIGFRFNRWNEEDGEVNWASVSLDGSEVMFSCSGKPSFEWREFDLYIHVEKVDEVARRIRDKVDVVEDVHETFYGVREFIIRDANRFWITFGEPGRRLKADPLRG